MTLRSLYTKLKESYTHDTLHRITTKIIALYKNKQYHALQKILAAVEGETAAKENQPGKTFYKLMMIYHPDRLKYYDAEIEKLYKAKKLNLLHTFAHIFSTEELVRTLVVLKSSVSEEPSEERYEWEEQQSGFSYEDGDDERSKNDFFVDDDSASANFYSILKRNIYGHENIELPFYYLEDLDSLELSGYGIETLDGIQHCVRLQRLDLSQNRIDDISELSQLATLEELFLADNQIGYIDSLSFLLQLRTVDLSGNRINDISPLFALQHLEYVNLLGNPVPAQQIQFLRLKGVVVIL